MAFYMYGGKEDEGVWHTIMFRNENKLFAWLCEILRPEYNSLERKDVGYDVLDDSFGGSIGDAEYQVLKKLLRTWKISGPWTFEIPASTTKSGQIMIYHYETEIHYWLSGRIIDTEYECFDPAYDEFDAMSIIIVL